MRHLAPGTVDVYAAGNGLFAGEDNSSLMPNFFGGALNGGFQWGVSRRLNLSLSAGLTGEGVTYGAQGAINAHDSDAFTIDYLVGFAGTVDSGDRERCLEGEWGSCVRSERATLKYLTFAPSTGVRFNWKIVPRVTVLGLVRSSYSRTVITRNPYGDANQDAFWLEHALGLTARVVGGFRIGAGLNTYNDYKSLGVPLVAYSLSMSYAFDEKREGER